MTDHSAELLRVCRSAGARLEYLLDLHDDCVRRGHVVKPDYVVDVLRVCRDELRAATEQASNTATETTA